MRRQLLSALMVTALWSTGAMAQDAQNHDRHPGRSQSDSDNSNDNPRPQHQERSARPAWSNGNGGQTVQQNDTRVRREWQGNGAGPSSPMQVDNAERRRWNGDGGHVRPMPQVETQSQPMRRDGDWVRDHVRTPPVETQGQRRWTNQAGSGQWAQRHVRVPAPNGGRVEVARVRDHNWSRNWQQNHRYDWRSYRDQHRSIFRIGFYYDPYGYQYRRWQVGWTMWPSYYQQSNWLDDPWMYRLPPVYGPYRWVRYWDDALLVNTYTGQVVDVLYDFFW